MFYTGADPEFQVRGGSLKNIAPSGGRRENFGVFRVKNQDFTPKKSSKQLHIIVCFSVLSISSAFTIGTYKCILLMSVCT